METTNKLAPGCLSKTTPEHLVDRSTCSPIETPSVRCDGTWGLAILNKADPDNIVVACNGSPMVIGLAQGEIFVASETAAFNRHTKNFIAMKVCRQFWLASVFF